MSASRAVDDLHQANAVMELRRAAQHVAMARAVLGEVAAFSGSELRDRLAAAVRALDALADEIFEPGAKQREAAA